MLPCQEVIPDMGSASRQSPEFLARKLRKIREVVDGGLSQEELVSRLGLTDEIDRTYISKYEAGVLEPPLKVLLRYAEVAGVYLEVLADDSLELPANLPCVPKSLGVRKPVPRASRKRRVPSR
jgi:transcriptional regulator with XRE-family HTH domain